MKPDITKLLVAARQTVDTTVFVENNNQTSTALGPQLEDPPRAATARAALVVATPPLVAVTAVVVAAVMGAHHTALAEELVEVTIVETEATRTATPPATHAAATTPATGSRRSVANRLL
jgi:hypothetical protein